MRNIAQKGAMASKVKKAVAKSGIKTKKAQDGVKNFDFSETNRYTYPNFASKMMSGAYEAQPFVKAKRAEEKRRATMTPEEKEVERINVGRITSGKASKMQKGGKMTKAQAGVKAKKVVVKAKAKHGIAKKASSKRSK